MLSDCVGNQTAINMLITAVPCLPFKQGLESFSLTTLRHSVLEIESLGLLFNEISKSRFSLCSTIPFSWIQ